MRHTSDSVDDQIAEDTDEVCWLDVVGDELEAEGVKPGCIYEFQSKLREGCRRGGIITFTEERPDPMHIDRVVVQLDSGEKITLSGRNPLVLASWRWIQFELT